MSKEPESSSRNNRTISQLIGDSFTNTIKALMWPVYVVQMAPPYGAIGLGLAFVGFTKFLKAPIERWMFPDEEGAGTE